MAEINGAALCVKDMRNLPLVGLNVWGAKNPRQFEQSNSASVQIGVLVEDEIFPNVRKLLREEIAQERELKRPCSWC